MTWRTKLKTFFYCTSAEQEQYKAEEEDIGYSFVNLVF